VERIVGLYLSLLKWIIVTCMAGMVVLVFSNVVLRYAFNSGLTVSEEVARWMFVWMIFVGAILVLLDNGHLGFNGIVNSLPQPLRRIAMLIARLAMIYMTYLIITGAWIQLKVNWNSYAPATGLSRGYFFLAGVVFGVGSLLILLWQTYQIATGRIDKMIVFDEEAEAISRQEGQSR
tara:strand:+ start:276 stop:806 length:531 start_codon:yes stop_codon:yes gene_type:complete